MFNTVHKLNLSLTCLLLTACTTPTAQPKQIVLGGDSRCLIRDGVTAREVMAPAVVQVADTPFTAVICKVDNKWRGFYVRNEITKEYGGSVIEPAYGIINVGG